MIDISPEYFLIIKNILKEHFPELEVRAFGSRIDGKAKKFSDLDLVLVGKAKLDWQRLEALKDAFAASNLPFMVDVVDWHAIRPEFRRLIEAGYEVIQKGE